MGPESERTRSTSLCLSTPRSPIEYNSSFDFNLKIFSFGENMEKDIKHALKKERIKIPTLSIIEVKNNIRTISKNFKKKTLIGDESNTSK